MGFGSSKQTVGYRYLAGIHMGVSRGPIDELVEIQVGDRTAWRGSVTQSERIFIDSPKLFGGDKSEGGIQGYCDVMMGEPIQGLNARLAAMLTGVTPAFRGVFTMFYDGLISALNPYPKSWAMRVRRAKKGWQDDDAWYPERAVVPMADGQIMAMNPAHMLVEANTNDDWGRGLPRDQLDLDSYKAAADKLAVEGFGLCFRWNRQEKVSVFLQQVIDHIGATQFVSRRTGLLTIRLIRDDYVLADLPAFDYTSGLLAIDDDSIGAQDTAANEVIVNWRDPLTRKDRQSRERNLGAIRAAGSVNTTTTDYPGIPTAELAHRVAARDVLAASSGARLFKVRLDRRGYALEPGQAFVVRAPDRGIGQVILRAAEVDYGRLTEGTVTVTCALDVFGLPDSGLYGVEPGLWVPPDRVPYPVTLRRVYEMTLRDMYLQASSGDELGGLPADLGMDPSGGIVQAVGARPAGVPYSYTLQARVAPADYADVGVGDFCPTGVLRHEISATATILWLADQIDVERVGLGSAVMIGDEIVQLRAQPGEGMQVARGCVDTVPVRHPAGTRVFFYEGFNAGPLTRYALGATIDARMLTNTSTDQLAPALAPVDQYQVIARDARPYPPGAVTVNSVAYPEMAVSYTGTFVFAWAHRDRLAQADILVDCTRGNIGPELGVTYDIEIYRISTGALVSAIRDIPGVTATLDGSVLPLLSTPAQGFDQMTFGDTPPNSAAIGPEWSVSGGQDWRTVTWRVSSTVGFQIPLAGALGYTRQAVLVIETAYGGQLDFDYEFSSWRATFEIQANGQTVLTLGRDDYRRTQAGHLVVQLPAGVVSLRMIYVNPADGFEEVAPTRISNLVVTAAGELVPADPVTGAQPSPIFTELSGDFTGSLAWGVSRYNQRLAIRGTTAPGVSKTVTRTLPAAATGNLRFTFGVDIVSGTFRVLVGGREVWALRADDGRVLQSSTITLPVLPGSGAVTWEYVNSEDGQNYQTPAGIWVDNIVLTPAEGQVIDPCRVELFSKRPHVENVAGQDVTTMVESFQRFKTQIAGAVPASTVVELVIGLVSIGYGSVFTQQMRTTYPQSAGAVVAFDAILAATGVNGLYNTGRPANALAFTGYYNSSYLPPALPLLSGITGSTISYPAGDYALSGFRLLNITAFGASSTITGLLIAFEGNTPWTAGAIQARFRSTRDEAGVNFDQVVSFSERINTAVSGIAAGVTIYVARNLAQAAAFQAAMSTHRDYEVQLTV